MFSLLIPCDIRKLVLPILYAVASLFAPNAAAQNEAPAIFQREPRPMPSSLQIEAKLQLETYFSSLAQGGVGLLRLSGDGILGARAEFRRKTTGFFHADDGDWYTLIAADMGASPRAYPLTVQVARQSGEVAFTRELRIDSANFIVQNLNLPRGRAYLADPEIESAELALLESLTSEITPAPLWDASGFELPHDSELSTPFGTFRRLGDDRQSRHTGWDQNVPTGAPIQAMAAGEVIFADALAIRGNYALINHGLGVYSGYAHFSELHVDEGQPVAAGQIIGLSGNTGRSSAPHLHWEIALRGRWVDGLAFLDLWLPSPSGAQKDAGAAQ